jgi:GTP-binding protein EngB required for normal cell division
MAPSNNIQLPSLQQLQSAEQVELMDVVDSLRAQGLSEFTALPQWIVCGDQSSGKSSLLEAISGIPFPRHENLCTRFATEVILRRAPRHRISVSIIPSKDRKGAERALLLQFRHELSALDDFPKLFKMAKEAMGLSSTSKSLSDNVLRVEFCGPSQPQLTLVDLPGLFHSHGKSQSEEDVSLVHNLVSQYIENPRSIILAVLSAKYDYNNQIIIRKVRDVDPKGSRVLGIITKPDTLPKGSDSEKTFIALAKNEEVRFDLGWHVVRNLDSSVSDISDVRQASRDEQETQYFKESAFNCLPSHTIGIASLRNRLSKLLFNQIRTELPQLAIDIESQMAAATALRDRLGPSRLAGYEQRSFLTHLSQDFQAICRDAVRGDYDDVFFRVDDNPERRLCANLMNLHFKFARNLRKRGAYWIIEDEKTQKSDSASINGESIDYSGSEESNQEESDDEANDDDESEDDAIDESRLRTREEAIKEASKLLKRSRGREVRIKIQFPYLFKDMTG